jgi:protein SCO1
VQKILIKKGEKMLKKYFKIISIPFITSFIFFGGCGNPEVELNSNTEINNVSNEKSDESSCCSSSMDSEEFTDNSVYQLDDEWKDQSGSSFALKELKGEKVVFTMFFASCTYACPILVNDMKKIEAEIPKKELPKYKFVLVSIDPERDTPARLSEFAELHQLDLNRWKLLTGSEGDIMEIAALTGFKYKKETSGEYSHSNIITFLNEDGEVEYQHKGLNKDVSYAVSITLASGN